MLTEIDTARQLAHDEQIDAVFKHGLSHRRGRCERSKELCGAKICEKSKLFSDRKKRFFGALCGVDNVPFRTANRAKQHAVACLADLYRFLSQRDSVFVDRATADISVAICKFMTVFFGYRIKHLYRFIYDLGAYSVAS